MGVLYLNGLKAISYSQAVSLSNVEFCLYLQALTTITDKQLEELSKVSLLDLSGLTRLTDEQATSSSGVRCLCLKGLAEITDTQAKSLAQVAELKISTPYQRKLPLVSPR